jgi:hypothetical protein
MVMSKRVSIVSMMVMCKHFYELSARETFSSRVQYCVHLLGQLRHTIHI